ncbi:MAG: hypothetical protein GDA54_05505 [Alphaproteobacteria bacterium GM7ARS4]|nr:hypothetical protein [Alphaproteobacteria bacterium GM7ARS4]
MPKCSCRWRLVSREGGLGLALGICVALLSGGAEGYGEETRLKVSVLSKGAKFIGSSLGGARVLLRDKETGEILAQGVTKGTTGSTAGIMLDDREAGRPLSTADSAHYSVTLDLEKPRLIEFQAYGPLAQRQAANRASMTQWVVPGKHIDEGDGMMLVLAGMAVDIVSPLAHRRLELAGKESYAVPVVANVTMMCGCPLTPDGLWRADDFVVEAVLSDSDDKVIARQRLRTHDIPSRFSTQFDISTKGWYQLMVYAYQASTGNTGLDRTSFAITQ